MPKPNRISDSEIIDQWLESQPALLRRTATAETPSAFAHTRKPLTIIGLRLPTPILVKAGAGQFIRLGQALRRGSASAPHGLLLRVRGCGFR
jgi:hypothetical protein